MENMENMVAGQSRALRKTQGAFARVRRSVFPSAAAAPSCTLVANFHTMRHTIGQATGRRTLYVSIHDRDFS
jgi:hypothetical protein